MDFDGKLFTANLNEMKNVRWLIDACNVEFLNGIGVPSPRQDKDGIF